MRKLFAGLVETAGNAANAKLTTAEARDAGVWLADDADKRDIGEPLGAIVGRRLGILSLKSVDDAEDLVNVLCAAAAYVQANVNKLIQLARARRNRGPRIIADVENGATP